MSEKIDKLSNSQKEQLIKEAIFMSKLGINSDLDLKNFSALYLNIDEPDLINQIYKNKEKYPISSTEKFIQAIKIAKKELNMTTQKKAYPNAYFGESTLQKYNIQNWIQALQEVYKLIRTGIEYNQAFNQITHDWDNMEKLDFQRWTKFYQGHEHEKYKTAQYMPASSVNLPFEPFKARVPNMLPGEQNQPTAPVPQIDKKEKIRRKVEQIIGRLNSAEKLVADPEVQKALRGNLGMEVSEWLGQLHALKRQIQVAPMRTAESSILEDLIVKNGNVLVKKGYTKAGNFMISLAQEEGAADSGERAFDEFIRRLNGEKIDEQEADGDDCLEVEDEMITEAQLHPTVPPPVTPAEEPIVIPEKAKMQERPTIEVSEEEEPVVHKHKKRESVGDDLIGDVTLQDAIDKLEAIYSILMNRELPRQLALADLMLHRINLASFFPSLGEATRSALESHQYMLTRVEGILTKLRASVPISQTKEITLDHNKEELESAQDNLSGVDEKRLENKEKVERAKIEEAKKEEPPQTPPFQELQAPVKIQPLQNKLPQTQPAPTQEIK